MFYASLRRGALAGAVGGVAFGAYTALVVNPLVSLAETFEAGHGGGHAGGHEAMTALTSVGGGVLWGLLLGVAVFGLAYFFFEPAIPGPDGTESFVLGAAGLFVVSLAPWLALPPQPPGAEAALPTATRLQLYAGMMLAAALACGLAAVAYRRLRAYGVPVAVAGGALPLVGVLVLSGAAPPNPTALAAPEALRRTFQGAVVAGQLGLWAVLSAVHAALVRRVEATPAVEVGDPSLA